MKKIIVLTTGIIALITSCSKPENNKLPQPATPSSPKAIRMTGEDDERKILMKIFNEDMAPIQGAIISMTNGRDSITGKTNEQGECLIQTEAPDTWIITINHPAYTTAQLQVNLRDSLTEITYIMKK